MNRFRNFTLIELLVVITIITILAAMLLPSLNQARTRAKSTACLSQHKQFGTALAMYAADFQDDIPTLADNPVKLKNSDSTPPAGLGLLAAHLGYSLGRDSKSAEDKGKLKIFKCRGGQGIPSEKRLIGESITPTGATGREKTPDSVSRPLRFLSGSMGRPAAGSW